MKKLITIADWASDSLARQEVNLAIQGMVRDPTKINASFVGSTASTIHVGYLARQVVETVERYGQPLDTIVFLDTAGQADLLIIRLKSGVHFFGANTGNVFSFLLDKIDEVFTYSGLPTDSVFPARDVYARVAAHLMESLQDEMELEEAHLSLIPGTQDSYIGHIDSRGILKTTIKSSELKGIFSVGSELEISIDGVKRKARYIAKALNHSDGGLQIFPGSSGDPHNPNLDISSWGSDTVSPGMIISIK